jgi:hypothetical protein
MERNEFYKQNWINYNEEKENKYNNIFNDIYNTELLLWETNDLNYYIICRVELDNSKENIVAFPECDLIVHKL